MSLIDNDLLSIQEARILLEHAAESAEVLEGLPASLVDDFLTHLREREKDAKVLAAISEVLKGVDSMKTST